VTLQGELPQDTAWCCRLWNLCSVNASALTAASNFLYFESELL